MASTASAILSELTEHLQAVDADPATPLDRDLLEKCELYTSTSEYRSETWKQFQPLFFQLAVLLPKLQQDPAPLNHFILKLAAPYSFDQVKELDFGAGLALVATPFHELILTLLEKATATGIDAEKLANRPDIVQSVVRLLLCTSDPGIASKAEDLVISLLKVSTNTPAGLSQEGVAQHGRGPIWKRIFEDKGIYDMFYIFCSLKPLPSEETPLFNRDKTLAQARLLQLLPKVGVLDWSAITTSHHPEVEQAVGLSNGQGLLHFATLHMVDTKDDLLMHNSLINFYWDLISTVRTPASSASVYSSLSLEFLKEHGVHKNMIMSYTEPTPGIEHSFLGGRIANYVSAYASIYPDNFEQSPEKKTILQWLSQVIRKCEIDDLHVLASLPRTSLLQGTQSGSIWTDTPVLSLPIKRTTPEALKTLATIFHGPLQEDLTFPIGSSPTTSSPSRTHAEQYAARALLCLYYTRNTSMFSSLIHHAETLAIPETALASLVLLNSIITANWSTSPPPSLSNTSESSFSPLQSFPSTGMGVLLEPSISQGALPYLLKPATSFSNLVGGRGDAENAAYKVGVAKFEVLRGVERRLGEAGFGHEIESRVRRRVAEGVWGVGGGVGSRIGTIDM